MADPLIDRIRRETTATWSEAEALVTRARKVGITDERIARIHERGLLSHAALCAVETLLKVNDRPNPTEGDPT